MVRKYKIHITDGRHFLATTVIPQGLEGWYHDDLRILVNPTGSFVQGGPSADAGDSASASDPGTDGSGAQPQGKARMTAADIDAVILVGGPTRLPIIRNSVRHYFQKEPKEGINPDQVHYINAHGTSTPLGDLADSSAPGTDVGTTVLPLIRDARAESCGERRWRHPPSTSSAGRAAPTI